MSVGPEVVSTITGDSGLDPSPPQCRPENWTYRRALAQHRMSVSKLAELLDISKQGAAQIATDMERRGYLARRPDPDDGRAWLPERGTAALAAARAFHHRYERGLVKRCGTETVAVLRSGLSEIAGSAASRPDPRLKALSL